MAEFTDSAGRTWTLDVPLHFDHILAFERLSHRAFFGVLNDMGSEAFVSALHLPALLYAMLEDKAVEAGVTYEDFCGSLADLTAMKGAIEAMTEALPDFGLSLILAPQKRPEQESPGPGAPSTS